MTPSVTAPGDTNLSDATAPLGGLPDPPFWPSLLNFWRRHCLVLYLHGHHLTPTTSQKRNVVVSAIQLHCCDAMTTKVAKAVTRYWRRIPTAIASLVYLEPRDCVNVNGYKCRRISIKWNIKKWSKCGSFCTYSMLSALLAFKSLCQTPTWLRRDFRAKLSAVIWLKRWTQAFNAVLPFHCRAESTTHSALCTKSSKTSVR